MAAAWMTLLLLPVLLVHLNGLAEAQAVACNSATRPETVGELWYTGYFWSPEYPNNYPMPSHCEWNITVPSGVDTIIRMDFEVFETETCCDLVRVYDGNHRSAPMIRQISGIHNSTTIPSIFSTGPAMYVYFSSDTSFNFKGFLAKYRSDPACHAGGVRHIGHGEMVDSPYFPYQYPNEETCNWYPYNGGAVTTFKLNFTNFNLEDHPTCDMDVMTIDVDGNLFGRYCGFNNPGVLFLTGVQVRVYFRSNSAITMPGFRFYVTFEGGQATSAPPPMTSVMTSVSPLTTSTVSTGTGSTTTPSSALSRDLSIGIIINGTLEAPSEIGECSATFRDHLKQAAWDMLRRVNELLAQGLLCVPDIWKLGYQDVHVSTFGMKATVKMDFFLLGVYHRILEDHNTCSHEISDFIRVHSNWPNQPILPQIPGCPAAVFNPGHFDYVDNAWFCYRDPTQE